MDKRHSNLLRNAKIPFPFPPLSSTRCLEPKPEPEPKPECKANAKAQTEPEPHPKSQASTMDTEK